MEAPQSKAETPQVVQICPKCCREFTRLRDARPHIVNCKGRRKHLPPKLLAGSGCEVGLTEHFQDIALGEDGNIAIVTENRLHILTIPINCRRKEVLSAVTVNCEYPKKECGEEPALTAKEHWYTMGSNGVTGVKRVFWLPNISGKRLHLLALQNNGCLVLYRQCERSLQWEECGNYSKTIKMFVKANEQRGEGLVDVFMTKEVEMEGGLGKVELLAEEKQFSDRRTYHTIDSHTMLKKYATGLTKVYSNKKIHRGKLRKIGRPAKVSFKTETVIPWRQRQVTDPPDLVVPKTLIKQLTRTSKDGTKRLVKIIDPDGERADEDEGEENVNCPCGAREEDSSADEEWVECELCHVWQHMDCVGYYPEVQDYFHCEDCLKKREEEEKEKKKKLREDKKKKTAQETPKKLKAKKERQRAGYVSDSDPQSDVDVCNTKGTKDLTPLQMLEQELGQSDSTEPSPLKSTAKAKTPKSGASGGGEGRESRGGRGMAKAVIVSSEESEEKSNDHINCPCGAETSESGEEWVQCDECDKWQHQECVNFTDGEKYVCPVCEKLAKELPSNSEQPNITPKPDPTTPMQPLTTSPTNVTCPSKPKEIYNHNLGPPIEQEDFTVVGRSDCKVHYKILQPVYVGSCKGYDKDSLKYVCMVNGAQSGETEKVGKEKSESDGKETSGAQKDVEEKESEGERKDVGVEEEEEKEEEVEEEREVEKFMFMFLIYERFMLILRLTTDDLSSPSVIYCSILSENSPVICSAVRTLGEREYCIAAGHYSGDIQIMWYELVSKDGTIPQYKYRKMSYPVVQQTDKILISSEEDCGAERLGWSGDRLAVMKLQCIRLYSVTKEGSALICAVAFDLPFVIDWDVSQDSVSLFDMYGDDLIIDLNTQQVKTNKCVLAPPIHEVSVLSSEPDDLSKPDQNKRFKKANIRTTTDIDVLRTLISTSTLLKCQVLLFKKELSFLGHLVTMKLTSNVTEIPEHVLKTHPKEVIFLQTKYNIPIQGTKDYDENEEKDKTERDKNERDKTEKDKNERDKTEKDKTERDKNERDKNKERNENKGDVDEVDTTDKRRRSSEVDIKPGLRKMFVNSLLNVKSVYHLKDTDLIRQILGEAHLTSNCPVCSEPLTLSSHPLLASCPNLHYTTLDPSTLQPLEDGLECEVCGALNKGEFCGLCWGPTMII